MTDINSEHYRDLCRYHIGYEITWQLIQQGTRMASLDACHLPKLCVWIGMGKLTADIRQEADVPETATVWKMYALEDVMMEEVVRQDDGRKAIICRPDPRKVTALADGWIAPFLAHGLRLNPSAIPSLEEGLEFFKKTMREF